jgi:hypothetical protein
MAQKSLGLVLVATFWPAALDLYLIPAPRLVNPAFCDSRTLSLNILQIVVTKFFHGRRYNNFKLKGILKFFDQCIIKDHITKCI